MKCLHTQYLFFELLIGIFYRPILRFNETKISLLNFVSAYIIRMYTKWEEILE